MLSIQHNVSQSYDDLKVKYHQKYKLKYQQRHELEAGEYLQIINELKD